MSSNLTLAEAMRKVSVAMKEYVDANFQPKVDDSLLTTDKTVVGAINEILNIGSTTSEKEIVNAATHYDFPSIGNVDYIYKAYAEKKTYQWNDELLKYEPLNEETCEVENIAIINGGGANG